MMYQVEILQLHWSFRRDLIVLSATMALLVDNYISGNSVVILRQPVFRVFFTVICFHRSNESMESALSPLLFLVHILVCVTLKSVDI